MMRKAVRKVLTINLLGGFMLFGLFGCRGDDNNSAGLTSEPVSVSTEAPAPVLHLDDVTECFAWMNLSVDEIGISEEYMDSSRHISFDGNFFGSPVEYGRIYFLKDYDNNWEAVEHIYFSCSDLSFEDANEGLIKMYGQPSDIGEEAYVESNGGAVSWVRFHTGTATVMISKPSERDYFYVDVLLGEF